MNVKRMAAAGVAVGVFHTVWGAMMCGWLFNWVYTLEPTSVWKLQGGEAPGSDVMIIGFLLVTIMAFVYALIQKGVPGQNRFVKGLVFGLLVWSVGMLPGIYATYAFMNVANTVLVYWLIAGLVEMALRGAVIAAVYGE